MTSYGSQLRDYIESSPKRTRLLPLVHSTDVLAVRGIFQNRKIEARSRSSSGEGSVVSLSYGKSTHVPDGERQDIETFEYPVVFVLRSNLAANSVRVFPFDSALFTLGKLERLARRGVTLTSLEIGSSLDAAGRYVHVFYSSNDHYFDDKVNLSDRKAPCPIDVSMLADLLAKRGEVERDRRYFTVEVQIDSDIALNEDTVEHVVLPSFFREPSYGDSISLIKNIWGVNPSFYRACRFDPMVQSALASAKANEFIEERYVDE